MTDISILFFILLILNCLTEYLFNRMMLILEVLERKKLVYHALFAVLRIFWIYLCAWFTVPIPVLLIGLFVLLYLNILPYRYRMLQTSTFIMLIYLIYTSLQMLIIGSVGFLGFSVESMRAIVLSTTFIIFNIICSVILRYHPEFLWNENYDRSKVIIYTRFLLLCILYHVLDSLIITLYPINWIGYLLLVSGDILILVLMFNFVNYNYVFEKSESMRKEYEENEILIAQQYFEKENLKKLSEFDSLTKTYNRREISSIMLESIQNGHKLACVFIDLDGLKRTNDKYGHTFGDLMLQRFATACTAQLHENDYLARIGGDEFLLVFLDQELSYIEDLILTLQKKLLEPSDEKERIYFSYGISHNEASVENYIHSADQKMYECKNRKRCGVV